MRGVYLWAERGHSKGKVRAFDELGPALRVLESIEVPEALEGESEPQAVDKRLAYVIGRISAARDALAESRLRDIRKIRARVAIRLVALLKEALRTSASRNLVNPRGQSLRDYIPGLGLKNHIVYPAQFKYRHPESGETHDMLFPNYLDNISQGENPLIPQEASAELERLRTLSNEDLEHEAAWYLAYFFPRSSPRTLLMLLDYFSDETGANLASEIKRVFGTELTVRRALKGSLPPDKKLQYEAQLDVAVRRIALLTEILYRWSRPKKGEIAKILENLPALLRSARRDPQPEANRPSALSRAA